MRTPRSLAILAVVALLGACAGRPGPRFSQDQVERALRTAAGEAQPSRIVAAEIAFARAAREDGQWTAFRDFAAPGAIIHTPGGGIDAAAWLAGRQDPPEAVKWGPRAIWMSCDGVLALSEGRYRDPDGTIGSFVTLWQRQENGRYLWLYDTGTPDDPQPPAPPADEPLGEDAIVVTALDAVQGLVADCPASPRNAVVDSTPSDGTRANWISPDGTLAFRWDHSGGKRHLSASWLHEGRWQTALEREWPGRPAT